MKIKSNDKPVTVLTSKIETFCLIARLFLEKKIYRAVLARNNLLSGIRNTIRKKKYLSHVIRKSRFNESSKSNKKIMENVNRSILEQYFLVQITVIIVLTLLVFLIKET